MGSDLNRSCQVESSKVLWIVALVLGSVLVVQYFELPYGDRVLSLLPLGRGYFNSSEANGAIKGGARQGGVQSSLMNHSSPSLQRAGEGSVSKENIPSGTMIDINHTDEEDTIVRSVSVVPEKTSNTSRISPSSAEIWIAAAPNEANDALPLHHNASTENVARISPSSSVVPAPYEASDDHNTSALIAASPTASDVSSATPAAPSESVSPREVDVDVGAPVAANSPPATANKDGTSRNESNEGLNHSVAPSDEHSSVTNSPPPTEQNKSPENHPSLPSVASISDMNAMLVHSRATSFSEVYIYIC